MKIRDILFKICRNIMHHKFIKSFSELGFYLIAGMIYSLGSYTATLNESTKVRHVFLLCIYFYAASNGQKEFLSIVHKIVEMGSVVHISTSRLSFLFAHTWTRFVGIDQFPSVWMEVIKLKASSLVTTFLLSTSKVQIRVNPRSARQERSTSDQ